MIQCLIAFFIFRFTSQMEALSCETCGHILPEEVYDYNNDIQYSLYKEQATWDESLAICLSKSTSLATVDTQKKATFIAQILSETNIDMENFWIGGRKKLKRWVWVETGEDIPQKGSSEYPPWLYKSTVPRPGKNCLAIGHIDLVHPTFVQLGCHRTFAFICEKNMNTRGTTEKTVESGRVEFAFQFKYHSSTFNMYRAQYNWFQALGFCRAQKKRLAIINDSKALKLLYKAMKQSTPGIESTWVGGILDPINKTWLWLPSGETLQFSSVNLSLPRDSSTTFHRKHCLMVKRELENKRSSLYNEECSVRKSFICEEYHDIKPTIGLCHNWTLELNPDKKPWMVAGEMCRQRGGRLAVVKSQQCLNSIIEMMADHSTGVRHVWLGGKISHKSKWQWVPTNEDIPFPSRNMSDDLPWVDKDLSYTLPCLNLDRENQIEGLAYGMNCEVPQAFICEFINRPFFVKVANVTTTLKSLTTTMETFDSLTTDLINTNPIEQQPQTPYLTVEQQTKETPPNSENYLIVGHHTTTVPQTPFTGQNSENIKSEVKLTTNILNVFDDGATHQPFLPGKYLENSETEVKLTTNRINVFKDETTQQPKLLGKYLENAGTEIRPTTNKIIFPNKIILPNKIIFPNKTIQATYYQTEGEWLTLPSFTFPNFSTRNFTNFHEVTEPTVQKNENEKPVTIMKLTTVPKTSEMKTVTQEQNRVILSTMPTLNLGEPTLFDKLIENVMQTNKQHKTIVPVTVYYSTKQNIATFEKHIVPTTNAPEAIRPTRRTRQPLIFKVTKNIVLVPENSTKTFKPVFSDVKHQENDIAALITTSMPHVTDQKFQKENNFFNTTTPPTLLQTKKVSTRKPRKSMAIFKVTQTVTVAAHFPRYQTSTVQPTSMTTKYLEASINPGSLPWMSSFPIGSLYSSTPKHQPENIPVDQNSQMHQSSLDIPNSQMHQPSLYSPNSQMHQSSLYSPNSQMHQSSLYSPNSQMHQSSLYSPNSQMHQSANIPVYENSQMWQSETKPAYQKSQMHTYANMLPIKNNVMQHYENVPSPNRQIQQFENMGFRNQ